MKTIFILPLFLIGTGVLTVFAQKSVIGSVSGKVIDLKTGLPLSSASVRLLHTDSLMKGSALTGKTGEFTISKIAPGSYILLASFVGYKRVIKNILITPERANADAGLIKLEEGIDLKEVSIKAEVQAIKVNGDTTDYNSAAFKTTPDAMAEGLLKKLPGIQVDRAGNITSDGERVTKVTVEGRDFFGNDPKMATRNLPADAIAKVQVINDKTEQAKSSGIDDGVRIKTINLVLKENKKQGWFGSSSVSGGTRERYLGSMSANRFTKDVQFNGLLSSNNMSQGYSNDEATNFSGGSGGGSMTSSGGVVSRFIGGVQVGNVSGINTSSSGGINYSDIWGKKNQVRFGTSYHMSGTASQTEQFQDIQTIQPEGIFQSNTTTSGTGDIKTHQFNGRVSATIDSLTSFTFNPTFSMGIADSRTSYGSFQLNPEEEKQYDVNRNTDLHTFNPSFRWSSSLSRRMHQRRGTISLYTSGNFTTNGSDNINRSENFYYKTGIKQLFDRLENQDRDNKAISISNSITRRMGKKLRYSFNITNGINISNSVGDQHTLEFDPISGKYVTLVDSLSNNSKTNTSRLNSSPGITSPFAKGTLTATAEIQFTRLTGSIVNKMSNNQVERNYLAVFPRISYSRSLKPGASLTVSASGQLSPPQVNDLMKIQYNADPLFIREGDPNLKPGKSYYANMSYRTSDRKKNTYANIYASYSLSTISTGRNSILNPLTGVRTSRPVNISGGYRFDINGSKQLAPLAKGLSVSPSFYFWQSRSKGFVNGTENNTDELSIRPSLSINYSFKEILSSGLSSTVNYSRNTNSAAGAVDANFWNIENSFDFSFEPFKTWVIKTDLNQVSYTGQNSALLNIGVQKFFMEKRQLALELKGFDILNNNTLLTRYVTANQVISSTSNNVRQFVYLKLTYRMNKLGSAGK